MFQNSFSFTCEKIERLMQCDKQGQKWLKKCWQQHYKMRKGKGQESPKKDAAVKDE